MWVDNKNTIRIRVNFLECARCKTIDHVKILDESFFETSSKGSTALQSLQH